MDTSGQWLKQANDKPLFADLLWSRPENRQLAGKLLIIGGNKYEFAAPAEAYAAATKAGIGVARILLPDSLKHTVGKILEVGDFAPSTPSGSFSQDALALMLGSAIWADGVLLAGDVGRNAETAIALEKFVTKFPNQLTITKDAADYFTSTPGSILGRSNTVMVISFAQLQRLVMNARMTTALTFDMGLVRMVEVLSAFTATHSLHIVVKHLDQLIVAVNGRVSTTKLTKEMETWRVKTAAYVAVWWLQNPSKPLEALSTAIYEVATGS